MTGTKWWRHPIWINKRNYFKNCSFFQHIWSFPPDVLFTLTFTGCHLIVWWLHSDQNQDLVQGILSDLHHKETCLESSQEPQHAALIPTTYKIIPKLPQNTLKYLELPQGPWNDHFSNLKKSKNPQTNIPTNLFFIWQEPFWKSWKTSEQPGIPLGTPGMSCTQHKSTAGPFNEHLTPPLTAYKNPNTCSGPHEDLH